MLQLEEDIQTLLIEGQIDAGHGKALLIAPETMRYELSRQIIRHGWNVRQAECKAKEIREKQYGEGVNAARERDPKIAHMEHLLAQHLTCPVHIDYDKKTRRGSIEIRFGSLMACQGILDRLNIEIES